MIGSILVVCVGNICRSPVGERLLKDRLPRLRVESAGLGALVGEPVDAQMAEVAAQHGLDVSGHAARQFSRDLARSFDLVLVMEPGHRAEILASAPELSGKTMAFDHWLGGTGIGDPYRRARDVHERAYEAIERAADAWKMKLA